MSDACISCTLAIWHALALSAKQSFCAIGNTHTPDTDQSVAWIFPLACFVGSDPIDSPSSTSPFPSPFSGRVKINYLDADTSTTRKMVKSCRNAACPNQMMYIQLPSPYTISFYRVARFAWYSWFSFSRISVNRFFLSASRNSLFVSTIITI
jgi:hypothetical protein